MGINVIWKDEQGKVLGAIEDNGVLRDLSNTLHRQSNSVCLRFIDPAGDACFNQLQLPLLVSELHGLLASVTNPRVHSHVQSIVALLEGATQSHTYIWFVGD